MQNWLLHLLEIQMAYVLSQRALNDILSHFILKVQPGMPSGTFPKSIGFMSCTHLDKEFGEGGTVRFFIESQVLKFTLTVTSRLLSPAAASALSCCLTICKISELKSGPSSCCARLVKLKWAQWLRCRRNLLFYFCFLRENLLHSWHFFFFL